MDRRTFSKLVAGTMTAAGIPGASAVEAHPAAHAGRNVEFIVPPNGGSDSWEYVILDAVPPDMTQVSGMAAADIDGDGKTEVVIIGTGSVVWYRPSTSEKGIVANGSFEDDVKGWSLREPGRVAIDAATATMAASPSGSTVQAARTSSSAPRRA